MSPDTDKRTLVDEVFCELFGLGVVIVSAAGNRKNLDSRMSDEFWPNWAAEPRRIKSRIYGANTMRDVASKCWSARFPSGLSGASADGC